MQFANRLKVPFVLKNWSIENAIVATERFIAFISVS